MVFRGKRRNELIINQVVPDKKRIYPGNIATHQAVTISASQQLKRFQAGTKGLCSIPHSIALIRVYPTLRWPDGCVVFNHHYARPEFGECPPNMISIKVNI